MSRQEAFGPWRELSVWSLATGRFTGAFVRLNKDLAGLFFKIVGVPAAAAAHDQVFPTVAIEIVPAESGTELAQEFREQRLPGEFVEGPLGVGNLREVFDFGEERRDLRRFSGGARRLAPLKFVNVVWFGRKWQRYGHCASVISTFETIAAVRRENAHGLIARKKAPARNHLLGLIDAAAANRIFAPIPAVFAPSPFRRMAMRGAGVSFR